ncbi:MAG TPA: hypothetical protein VMS54_12890 [Vicinamibacterales bacterium]|nr:hypothetical protein [Vicinamibacterales bacterium]
MKKTIQAVFLTLLAAQVLVVGQGADAKKIVADIRAALGGEEKLAALKTIAVEGQVSKVVNENTSAGSDFELAIELPGKFMKREVFANIGGMQLKRRTGFNGSDAIEEMDAPPSMGGNVHIMRAPGPGGMVGGVPTPEALAKQRAQLLASSRREFARLMVGMTGGTSPEFPVEFVYGGQAEARDGKADILDVKGPDGFAARLFVDGKTHLPLMLTWMDKEPLSVMVTNDGRGGGARGGGGGFQVMTAAGVSGSPEELAKMRDDMAARMAEAEAKRRVVEYRLFYGEYKAVDGVKMPTRVQRMVDGIATEEITLEKIKINQKIDPAKFSVVK